MCRELEENEAAALCASLEKQIIELHTQITLLREQHVADIDRLREALLAAENKLAETENALNFERGGFASLEDTLAKAKKEMDHMYARLRELQVHVKTLSCKAEGGYHKWWGSCHILRKLWMHVRVDCSVFTNAEHA